MISLFLLACNPEPIYVDVRGPGAKPKPIQVVEKYPYPVSRLVDGEDPYWVVDLPCGERFVGWGDLLITKANSSTYRIYSPTNEFEDLFAIVREHDCPLSTGEGIEMFMKAAAEAY